MVGVEYLPGRRWVDVDLLLLCQIDRYIWIILRHYRIASRALLEWQTTSIIKLIPEAERRWGLQRS